MRIINRAEFLAMPAGTLFAKYEPCVFGEIQIKWDNMGEDFVCQELISVRCDSSGEMYSILDEAAEKGTSFELDLDYAGRDGCFDADQMFAVWERGDLAQLIARLQECLGEDHA